VKFSYKDFPLDGQTSGHYSECGSIMRTINIELGYLGLKINSNT